MTEEQEQETKQEPIEQTPQPKPVVADEIIKPLLDEKAIKELSESINELKDVQRNLFEQQKNFVKGANDNEDEQLTY